MISKPWRFPYSLTIVLFQKAFKPLLLHLVVQSRAKIVIIYFVCYLLPRKTITYIKRTSMQ